jgi:hypothetical protein
MIFLLYVKALSYHTYRVIGAYTDLQRALQEWDKFSDGSKKMEGKIETVKLDEDASNFASMTRLL